MSTAAPRPIRFVHQGRIQEVSGLPPTTTVLQWLRETAHRTGTKEGCAEGDCGACTVVVGERDGQTGEWRQQTVNACIRFLPTLDGKALLTVEDVAPSSDALHPCQQAMVDCHGSQCGFCTPGFVMSLWDVYEQQPQAPSRADLADAVAGNLCRCTGYRPILDAGEKMYEAPRQAFDKAPLLKALEALAAQNAGDGLSYEAPDADAARGMARFLAPTRLDELASLRTAMPHARLLAGSTDIGLWVNKQFRSLGDILYLGDVAELQTCTLHEGGAQGSAFMEIGAAVSLETGWAALTRHMPMLREMWKRFASPPVRHAGTLVGNLANGSPIGDTAPILLALDAELVLRKGDEVRALPLSAFYLDYMKNDLQEGEFIQSVRVPLVPQGSNEVLRAYKISKRRDCDISALCAGFWLRMDGDHIADARLGWGGMAGTAKRAAQTEAALRGQPWTEATLRSAQAALAQDFQPLTDLRATKDYRSKVAANLLERFWLETRPGVALLTEQVQVWPAPAA